MLIIYFCPLIGPNILPINAEQELLTLEVLQSECGTWPGIHPLVCHFRATSESSKHSVLCKGSDEQPQPAPGWCCSFESSEAQFAEHVRRWQILAAEIIFLHVVTMFGSDSTFNFPVMSGPKAGNRRSMTELPQRLLTLWKIYFGANSSWVLSDVAKLISVQTSGPCSHIPSGS